MCGERVGMLHIYYIKTPAGQEEMNARGPGLNARERQIMLMCSGQRPLQVLIELFGESVVRELHELVVQGYLQAVRRPPSAVCPIRPRIRRVCCRRHRISHPPGCRRG